MKLSIFYQVWNIMSKIGMARFLGDRKFERNEGIDEKN